MTKHEKPERKPAHPRHHADHAHDQPAADDVTFEFEDTKQTVKRVTDDGITRERKPIFFVPVTLWVIGAFAISSVLVGLVLVALRPVGFSEKTVDPNLFTTIASVAIYIVLLVLTLGLPRALKLWSGRISYRKLLGLTRLLEWRDILLAIVGFVVYLALGVAATSILQHVPGFDGSQAQDLGFSSTLSPNDGLLVFMILVVVAPIAEEIIFRGYLFGTLRRAVPVWAAILITSLLFGAIHGQWNVGVDVFFLSIVSCVLRLRTGSLWSSMLLHMMKNGLAFYILYIAPGLAM